jgi:BASS family bile acid:Na+ symporter
VKQVVDLAIPIITFLLMTAVGLGLTVDDFARVRRTSRLLVIGLLGPLVVLPLVAFALILWFRPDPATEAGLLLIAVCPIGGISNTYSFLARASTALSVTLTGLSSLLAVATIPLLTRGFERLLERPLRFDAPATVLVVQLLLMLALPVGVGMAARRRWPDVADRRGPLLTRLGFGALALLVVFVIVAQRDLFLAGLRSAVPMSAAFVVIAFAAGWLFASAARATRADRFTLAAEFATRNVAVATAIAVTMLGRVEFAVFATTYFLTELPLMLAAVAVHRTRDRRSTIIPV